MRVELRNVETITPYARNPRDNDAAVDGVAASIKEFGFQQPIVIDADGVIVVGHTRYKAARKLGLAQVPVQVASELTTEQVKAYRLLDNKLNEKATWEDELLGLELGELEEFDFEKFDCEWGDLKLSEPDTTEDEVPEVSEGEPVSKLGDVWLCGRHRVCCGDFASIDTLTVCDLLLTDPPYGIGRDRGFGGFGGFGKPIARRQYVDDWDSETPKKETFERMLHLAKAKIIFGGNFFTDKLPVGKRWLVWDKHQTMPTFSDCELAWTSISRTSIRKYDIEYNGLIGKEKQRLHPTQKPIALFIAILQDYSNERETVLDPFLGSGTTLIACERLGRTCHGCEILPKYVDVICRRFYNETGIAPVRELDGFPFPIDDTNT